MKKILAIWILVVFFAMTAVSVFGAGQSVFNQQFTMASGVTGTTAQVTGSAYTFDYLVRDVACDMMIGPSSTGTGTVRIDSNQGSSGTLFDLASNLSVTVTLASSTSATVIKSFKVISQASNTSSPVRTIRAVYTMPTTTNTFTLNCSGLQ